MSNRKTCLAIKVDGGRFLAARITPEESGGLRIHEWAVLAAPASIDFADADAVGRWLGSALDERGIGKAPVAFGVGRGEVVLKRLNLPGGKALNESEIAGMVRLQMVRQVTFAIEGAAVDYVPLRDRVDEEESGGSSLSVIAGALPGERLGWIRAVVRAAGLRLGRVALQSSGVGALLRPISERHAGPILGVSISGTGVEFVVVEDGQLVFARAADLSAAGLDHAELARRIGVEAKRTWMSYRVAREGAEVEAAYILGHGPAAERIAAACARALEMPAQALAAPGEIAGEVAEDEALSLQSLLALGIPGEDLDFAHPRRGPDLAAKRRQRVLAGVFAAIVVVGGGIVWSRIDLARLRDDVTEAKAKESALFDAYLTHEREHARLMHLREWQAASIDWFGHLNLINERMPDTKLALLDEVRGNSGAATVEFRAREGRYDGGKWLAVPRASLTLVGSVKAREIANDLRGRLLAEEAYSVVSTGPDVENRFVYGITSTVATPKSGDAP